MTDPVNSIVLNLYADLDDAQNLQDQGKTSNAMVAAVSNSLLGLLDGAQQGASSKTAATDSSSGASVGGSNSGSGHHKVMGMDTDSKQYKTFIQQSFKQLEQQNQIDQQEMEKANEFLKQSIEGQT